MRVLLTGAAGQLGRDLAGECLARGHTVLAFPKAQLDVTDRVAVQSRICASRPDWIINTAAFTDVDGAEQRVGKAMDVNAQGVRAVASAACRVGAVLLHYSTDYVFGEDHLRPYRETDRPSPLSAYGASKLLGELLAESLVDEHYVLRTAGLYSPRGRCTRRGNFVETVLRKCGEGVEMRVVDDQVTTPTFGPALAERSLDLLERRIPFGVYHLGGGHPLSWFDLAVETCRVAGIDCRIEPVSTDQYPARARRPAYSALSNRLIEAEGIAPMPTLEECLRRHLALRSLPRQLAGSNGELPSV